MKRWPIPLRGLASRFMRGLETLVLRVARPESRGQDVVIVRLDAIGDFVLWLDAARELKRIYPERRITLLANSLWADLAAALPYWDEVWPVDVARLRRRSRYRWQLLFAVRRRGFDVAVQPSFSRSFLEGDSLVRASGARERIGSVGDFRRILPWEKEISDGWYTRLLPATREETSELERNAEFIRHLGQKAFTAAIPALPRVAELPAHLRLARPYFILFPGASWHGREWPADRFTRLAADFSASGALMPVVCGSAGDASACRAVVDSADVEVLDLYGQATLPQFVELVRGARLLIGNETSAIHIAAAVGTPAVCILGGGDYGRFVPYSAADLRTAPVPVFRRMPCFGCKWACTQPHVEGAAVPCINGVAFEDVREAGHALLNGSLRRLRA